MPSDEPESFPAARAATAPDVLVELNKDRSELAVAANDNTHGSLDSASAPPASVSSSGDSGMNNSANEDSSNVRVISADQPVSTAQPTPGGGR